MRILSHLSIRQSVVRLSENANKISADELMVGTGLDLPSSARFQAGRPDSAADIRYLIRTAVDDLRQPVARAIIPPRRGSSFYRQIQTI
jgi:hypothetical protein